MGVLAKRWTSINKMRNTPERAELPRQCWWNLTRKQMRFRRQLHSKCFTCVKISPHLTRAIQASFAEKHSSSVAQFPIQKIENENMITLLSPPECWQSEDALQNSVLNSLSRFGLRRYMQVDERTCKHDDFQRGMPRVRMTFHKTHIW